MITEYKYSNEYNRIENKQYNKNTTGMIQIKVIHIAFNRIYVNK